MAGVTCAINTNDENIVQQFKNRMASAKIQVSALAASDSRYTYFRLEWNGELHRNKAGAKPKKLFIDGKEADCGIVWRLRNEGLSDAGIAEIFDIGESTVTRRRKKHQADGEFYDGSTIIF
jgi:hypothetical protein